MSIQFFPMLGPEKIKESIIQPLLLQGRRIKTGLMGQYKRILMCGKGRNGIKTGALVTAKGSMKAKLKIGEEETTNRL